MCCKSTNICKNNNCYINIPYRVTKCEKCLSIIETVLGELYAKELKKLPLADNTMGGRILNTSQDLHGQFIN
jgi:hypothetical protein